MSHFEALLAKVVEDPANDAPRLACAEALQSVDAARAEFIRVQLALPGRMDPARRRSLHLRARELMDAHGRDWLKPLRDAKVHEPRYHRGFIEELNLAEDKLAKHGPELFALEPVSRLCVDTRDGKGLERAAEQPWFSQVHWLRLEGSGVDAATKALASSPRAGHLTGLVLSGATDAAVRALVESNVLPKLRSVSFSSGALTNASAGLLSKATLPWGRLYLSGSGLSDEGVETLAGAKGLGALQWLTLNRNELSDEAAEALAKSKGLTGLERLELSKNDLSEEGALAFRTAKALPKLRRLELLEMGLDRDELGPLVKRLGAGLRL
ncbi:MULTISPECIES: TIGR02996 domain-containing protein [Myxococcus]|uniref:TIGR02996 domain-containing protein n=1 Tax=Myxococcus TaxID=32 RepID=UPI0013D1B545|nr:MULTISPECIES: TIGR02996 domain-containing protein [Myxococcus]NVJ28587.1 TIGR02996 domain-containing protein [Myxococcus sp. AM011]